MFLEAIGDYIAEGYVHFGDGEIRFGNQRIAVNFMPIQVREFIINNELSPETYPSTLFLAARREGYDFIKHHAIPLMKSWTPIVTMGYEWVNLFGGGSFRSIKADREKGFGIASGVSSFGLEMKEERPSAEPVDFIMAGLIAGCIQYFMKKVNYGVEISCVAQKGVQECVIVVGERRSIIDYVERFSPEKLEFANRTLDRIEAVERMLEDSGDKRWLL